jgi:hypothetical protein
MKEQKEIFLESQYWMMSVQAAFQRANIYKKDIYENQRNVFRDDLHQIVKKISESYKVNVPETQHIENIQKLQELSKNDEILQKGELNFGICQKLLNLYLKYLWCADLIPVPPHFPIDRIIQERLGFNENEIVSWTKDIKSRLEYKAIIDRARRILELTIMNTLAELELELYSKHNLKELLKK